MQSATAAKTLDTAKPAAMLNSTNPQPPVHRYDNPVGHPKVMLDGLVVEFVGSIAGNCCYGQCFLVVVTGGWTLFGDSCSCSG